MDRAKSTVGLILIGILEILIGLFGSWQLIDLLTYRMRTGSSAGMSWLCSYILIALTLFLLLGIGTLLRKKIAWFANIVIIPIIFFAFIFTVKFLKVPIFGAGIFTFCAIFTILIFVYLVSAKKQFK